MTNEDKGVLIEVRSTIDFTIQRMKTLAMGTQKMEALLSKLDAFIAKVPDGLADEVVNGKCTLENVTAWQKAAKLLANAVKEESE